MIIYVLGLGNDMLYMVMHFGSANDFFGFWHQRFTPLFVGVSRSL